jgi:threonine synthase
VEPVERQPTIASAVAAADPGLLGDQTLAAVRTSDGDALAVEEAEIIEAVRWLAQEGLMIEPSGAVTVAAVRRGVRDGLIDRAETVVCVLTGSGFKDFDRILDLVEIPRDVVSGYEAMLAEAEKI